MKKLHCIVVKLDLGNKRAIGHRIAIARMAYVMNGAAASFLAC